jgi:SAM-dependent methyltransferase
MAADADGLGPHEERWLLAKLDAQPWREVLAAGLARSRPALYARLTDPGQAAILSLLGIAPGNRCLDATAGWGQIAVPLARLAHVIVLAPSMVRGAIVRRIAAQEGVALDLTVGALGSGGFRAAAFDVLLLHHPPALQGAAESEAAVPPLAVLNDVARLLRPGGRAYLGATNALAPLTPSAAQRRSNHTWTLAEFSELFSRAGLVLTAAYACFPDHERPRFLVPLALTNDFIGDARLATRDTNGLTSGDAALATEGIAHHFAPSFAFLLRASDGAPASREGTQR